ncbi:MAG: SDR family oxidoreductase [SAR202 cluster bacterium]|nr:SDR family oxidoreductase [SAR202 cluster bacterium]
MTQRAQERLSIGRLLSQHGKTAIITGGAMGIGKGIADRFAEAEANVVIVDLNQEEAQKAVDAVVKAGGKAVAAGCDVSDESTVKATVKKAITAFGRVDVLVNNAGIYPFAPALQMLVAEWDRIQAVNLRGLFLFSREFANQVIRQGGGGVIVNIGSIDSLHPSAVGLAAYDASKGGVLMFTKNFALEVAPYGIRVNMIAPEGIVTEGVQKGLTGLTPEQMKAMKEQFLARVPLGRWGMPDDIATVALFLASPAASYMTGSYMVVDGGRLLT